MKKHVTLTKEHARLHIRTYHLQHEDWRNKLLSFSGLQLLAQQVPQQPGITADWPETLPAPWTHHVKQTWKRRAGGALILCFVKCIVWRKML
jgi:hypothetical protein